MIYGRDDMKRFGKAVADKADNAMHQFALNLQTQLALNPSPDAIEGCLEINLGRFRDEMERARKALEETL